MYYKNKTILEYSIKRSNPSNNVSFNELFDINSNSRLVVLF